jgi:copper chaperone CopZ
MTFSWIALFRGFALAGFLLTVEPVRAEYLRIELRVYGLDCELCARGVSASIQRMPGVKAVDVSLKKGLLEIVLERGNSFKMSDLRKRIRQNGFRSMEARVTAVGEFKGSKFEVLGSGESYDVGSADSRAPTTVELTFDVR